MATFLPYIYLQMNGRNAQPTKIERLKNGNARTVHRIRGRWLHRCRFLGESMIGASVLVFCGVVSILAALSTGELI